MDTEKLKEITKMANDAVKDLDPDLKKGAFDTILGKLLESNLGSPSEPRQPNKEPPKKSRPKKSATKVPNDINEATTKLLTSINNTKYPSMFKLKSALDRSLYLMKIAKDELNIDGLVASQISKVLTDKFRLKSTPNAVSMALMNNLKYVDRRPATIQGGAGFTYHMMHEGEKYLEGVLTNLSQEKKENVDSKSSIDSTD